MNEDTPHLDDWPETEEEIERRNHEDYLRSSAEVKQRNRDAFKQGVQVWRSETHAVVEYKGWYYVLDKATESITLEMRLDWAIALANEETQGVNNGSH